MAVCEIGGLRRKPIVMIFRPAEFDGNVLAYDKAAVAQPFLERCDKILGLSRRPAAQITNHWHRRLLRACAERPCRRRAAES
ncbi:MAG: hypothetical protein ACHP7H_02325 [Hyphomicrobiales bacterium]